jgi:Holliday junction resolvase-like predicted endonuclease
MNTKKKLRIGQFGELAVSIYLENKGYSVLARNLRISEGEVRGEIDILSVKDRVLHVVEVKTVCVIDLDDVIFVPESNLSKIKIRKLHKLRSVLIMRISEGRPVLGGNVSIKEAIPPISKVAITGVAVTLCMNANWFMSGDCHNCAVAPADITNNLIKKHIQSIKVRVFHDL